MEPFFQPDRLWPTGHRQLQLMIIPDLGANPRFADFVAQCRTVMAEHPATTEPVPDESLHLTVQPIGFPGRDRVDADTRARLVAALERELATVPAFELLLGSALVYHRGVVADTHHDDGFNRLLDRARPVIAEVCGPDAIVYDSRPAHLALCYAGGHGSSDDLQRQFRHDVRPGHATLTVAAVDLVETIQVPHRCRYDSTMLHRFPLATTLDAAVPAKAGQAASA
ncbi:2'-5' RNA ligase family protein [Amycolatopsis sp. NPDC101161]|uniref:2'-5' RNA ligase family protein n=1 Tax=Amycolatopsis sp. NPDC101161 TaxID=3363940 RepID=UPI0038031E30